MMYNIFLPYKYDVLIVYMSFIKRHTKDIPVTISADPSYQPQHPMFQNAEGKHAKAYTKVKEIFGSFISRRKSTGKKKKKKGKKEEKPRLKSKEEIHRIVTDSLIQRFMNPMIRKQKGYVTMDKEQAKKAFLSLEENKTLLDTLDKKRLKAFFIELFRQDKGKADYPKNLKNGFNITENKTKILTAIDKYKPVKGSEVINADTIDNIIKNG